MRPVQVALTQGNTVVIAKGLQAGDRVVTDGQEKLQAGSGWPRKRPQTARQSQARDRVSDRSHEYFPAVHSSARRHLAVDGGPPAGRALWPIRQLPVSALPQVDYPTIQVLTFYPGASPDVMASSVTAPLERQFGQVPGLNQMTSTSTFGASLIILQFNLDREH